MPTVQHSRIHRQHPPHYNTISELQWWNSWSHHTLPHYRRPWIAQHKRKQRITSRHKKEAPKNMPTVQHSRIHRQHPPHYNTISELQRWNSWSHHTLPHYRQPCIAQHIRKQRITSRQKKEQQRTPHRISTLYNIPSPIVVHLPIRDISSNLTTQYPIADKTRHIPTHYITCKKIITHYTVATCNILHINTPH